MSAFKQYWIISIDKVKKLDKWVPHKLSESQRAWHFEMCLMLFQWNSNDPFFLIKYWLVMKNRSFMTMIGSMVWSWWSTQILSKIKISWTEVNGWLSGGLSLALSITAFWNLTRTSLQTFTACNWMECMLVKPNVMSTG